MKGTALGSVWIELIGYFVLESQHSKALLRRFTGL